MTKKLVLIWTILICLTSFSQSFSTGNQTGSGFLNSYMINVSGVGVLNSSNFISTICVEISSDALVNGFELRITSPSGTRIDLIDRVTTLTGNSLNVACFTDFGTGTIATGTPPYNGSFTADDAIVSSFAGENANGNWEFEMLDWDGSFSDNHSVNVTITFVNCQQVIGGYTSSKALVDDTLRLCQGETINFQGVGTYPQNNNVYTQSDATSTFNWTFLEAGVIDSSFSTQNWSMTFNQTGSFAAQLRVVDDLGCDSDNDVTIPMEVTGRPSFDGTAASSDSVCQNEINNLNGSVTPFFISSACNQAPTATIELPDIQSTAQAYETQTTVSCYTPSTVINSIADIQGVCFNMEHSYLGDLVIEIECPNGQKTQLTDFPNVSGSYMGYPVDDDSDPGTAGVPLNYCFSPNSTNGIDATDVVNTTFTNTAGSSETDDILIPDTYQIDGGDWTDLIGCPVNGDWTLIITDKIASDNGYIFNWSLDFSPSLPIVTTGSNTVSITAWEWDTNPTSFTQNTTTSESTSGIASNTLTVTDEYGCQYDTTINYVVRAPNDPNCAPCTIDNITATPGACDANLEYDITGQVTFSVEPTTGTLTVLNRESGQSQVFTAPFTSPQPYTITGNPGDGGTAEIVAFFSDDVNCLDSTQITEPDCCQDNPAFAGTDLTQCIPANGSIQITGLSANITYDVSYNGGASASLTSDGSGVITIGNLTAGTYGTWVIIDNRASGCTYNDATIITLSDPLAPTLTFTGNNPSACGGTDGSVQISGLTGNGNYDISFNGGAAANYNADASGNITIGSLSSGAYTNWNILDNSTGCTFTDASSTALNEPGAPVVSITSDDLDGILCLGEAITLSYSTTPAGGTPTYSGPDAWTTGNVFTPSATGNITYSVSVDNAGCVGNASITITVNPLPNVDAGPDQTVCGGSMVTLSGSGANTYTWDNSVTDGVAFAGVPGLYTVTGTDVNNCTNTDTVRLNAPAGSQVLVNNDTTICAGQSVTITGSNAVSYSWDNGITNGQNVTPTDTTTYTVTATHSDGCTSIDSVIVTVAPLPTIVAMGNDTICGGNQTILYGQGGDTYTWDNGVTDSVAFFPVTGNYTVTGTDSNGCVGTDVITVRVENLPSINAGFDFSVCEGDSVVLTGAGGHLYTWDMGVTNGVAFYPTTTSTYTVTGTDTTFGCSNTDPIVVTVESTPVVSAGADLTPCAGQTITLTATGADTYSWSGGISNGVSFTAIDDSFIVTGTVTASGCSANDTVVVTTQASGDASFNYSNVYCVGSGATAVPTITQIGGTFSSTSGLNLNTTNGHINVDASVADSLYTIYYTIAGSCPALDSFNVSIVSTPDPSFQYTDTLFCQGQTALISLTGVPPTLDSIYSVPAGLVLDASGNINTTSSTPGNYIVYNAVNANPQSGCPYVADSAVITIIEKPTITAPFLIDACDNDSLELIATASPAGAGIYVEDFSLGLLADSSLTDTIRLGLNDGTYLFDVYSAINGCSSDTTLTIATVEAMPVAPSIIISDTVVCNRDDVTFNGIVDPAYTGIFSVGNGYGGSIADSTLLISNQITGILNEDTTMIVLSMATTACGILADSAIIINEGVAANANAGLDQSICLEDSAILQGNYTATGVGQWYTINGTDTLAIGGVNDSILNVGQISGGSQTFLWEVYIPSCNATLTDEVIVTTNTNSNTFTASTSDTNATEIPVNYTFSALDLNQLGYTWSLNDTIIADTLSSFSNLFLTGGTQTIEMTSIDSNGCLATHTIDLILTEPVTMYFPNAFTPNGVGDASENETFNPVGTSFDQIQEYSLIIYDRWGKIVFTTVDINASWNGTNYVDGLPVPIGQYAFTATYKIINNDQIFKKVGSVVLLR